MSKPTEIDSKLFGTDGIRSIAGKFPLTKRALYILGYSAGVFLKKISKKHTNKILIARDTRQSGNWIEKFISQGLMMSGCKVFPCGVLPTSAVSVLLQEARFAKGGFLAGVVLSASHNPAEFNGIKFFSSNGNKIPDLWESEIEKYFCLYLNGKSPLSLSVRSRAPKSLIRGHGIQKIDSPIKSENDIRCWKSQYIEFLKNAMPSDFSLKGLRWVLDCANGAASKIAPEVFGSLGAIVKVLHAKPNGKNINLGGGALYPQSLQKEVLKFKAMGGCAFDGDADRVQLVDEEGRLMDGDILLSILSEAMQKKGELHKKCVVTTVMANFGFHKRMEQKGIRVITTNVGDRSVSDAVKSYQASLGGEQSGHIIFPKLLPTGDGILTALKVLSALKESKKRLSFFTNSFPKVPQVLLNIKVKRKIPIGELPELQKQIRQVEKELGKNGKILVRYSGTEPLLRIMIQGISRKKIQKLANRIASTAKKTLW